MATRIEQLISVVEAEVTVDDSVLTLLTGFGDVLKELRADVAAQGFDPAAVDKAIADLTSKQALVLAAVKSGTELLAPPVAPAPVADPAPVVATTPPTDTLPGNSGTTTPSAPVAPAPSNTPLPVNDPATSAPVDVPATKVQSVEGVGQAAEPGPAAPAQPDGSGTPLTGDPNAPGSTPDHS